MSKKLYEESNISNIADAIRAKNGTQNAYETSQMPAAIRAIETEPDLEELNVSANGAYLPSSGKDGFSNVSVYVPNTYAAGDEGKVVKNGSLVSQTSRSITDNGTYDTTENDLVTVEISGGGGSAVIQPLSVTQNGTYNPPSGVDGYAPVTVNVSGGSGGIGPVYSGTDVPSASIGADEDLYVQYEEMPSVSDHTYRTIAWFRKVNGAWVPYTIPVMPTKGVHIWTKSIGGTDAAMYVQDGYWDTDNNIFVATGEVEIVVHSTVRSWYNAKDCNGVVLLAYPSNWQIKASTTVTDGSNVYQNDAIVAQWVYGNQKDIYIWKTS